MLLKAVRYRFYDRDVKIKSSSQLGYIVRFNVRPSGNLFCWINGWWVAASRIDPTFRLGKSTFRPLALAEISAEKLTALAVEAEEKSRKWEKSGHPFAERFAAWHHKCANYWFLYALWC